MTHVRRCSWFPECDCHKLTDCEDRPTPPLWAQVVAWLCILFALAVGISALSLSFVAMTASAQEARLPCGPYDNAVKFLKEKYGEVPVGGGVVNETTIVQRFASPNGDTFTILSLQSNGTACMLIEGKNWEETPNEDKGV